MQKSSSKENPSSQGVTEREENVPTKIWTEQEPKECEYVLTCIFEESYELKGPEGICSQELTSAALSGKGAST